MGWGAGGACDGVSLRSACMLSSPKDAPDYTSLVADLLIEVVHAAGGVVSAPRCMAEMPDCDTLDLSIAFVEDGLEVFVVEFYHPGVACVINKSGA